MASTKINVDALSTDQLKELLDAAKARQAAPRVEAKRLTSEFVSALVTSETVPEQTFKSGAVGYSTGGKFEVDGRKYRVSVLVRDEATIPAKDES